ncbi:ABC transporter ATP-binding protein [Alcaligenes faecalis]|uniref:ABC transporter ATP-binding protein n=1 Tax=Alcaligenes faecalis TaxID=511 RepID=UPI0005A63FE6|nr:ABC transporter ATP-binding protein [Alcaligenes faecalis]ATH98431.1 ABC transporter ATP-binding protein [Alcaligenes faecalis]AYZ91217.1 ABC transporter ATP-binding protein [Alcaligenes faecalis]MCX5594632.1 ABC transporter ATP-binding protein [Alcaligenes faecalis]QQC32977.1 ABC transporter ATP-binding protein [Alcaligenes faecalis]CAJ0892546.1 ABC transporter ATP-binding protein [Alcaligenes faecalis subsp. faecalis]
MTTRETATDARKEPGPISQILSSIRSRLIVAAVLAALGSMLTLVPLAGIAHIATLALGNTPSGELQGDIGWTVLFSIVSMFAGLALISAGELLAHLADNQLTRGLRLSAAQRLAKVPLGWFTGQASGEVKQAMQDDIATLHSLTAHFYTSVGRALGAIAISVLYLFFMDWRMAIVALLPFPGFFLFLHHAMKASSANMQGFVEKLGRLNSATVEFVSGIPVVKAFGSSGQAHGGYSKAVDGFADAFLNFARPLVARMAHAHAMIAPVTVLGVVLIFGALFSYLDWMAPVDILPFALVAPGICAPLLLLHTLLHDLGGATGAAQHVQALMKTPVLETLTVDQQQVPANQEVRVENVSYAYGEGHQALSNISFTLEPGTVTAIVGSSGSGKSTIARLLLRFFDPSEGRITLGGADLRQIESTELYRRIGFVLQEVRLINASVRENIALGRPSASQQEIEDAARAANIHDRILSLPHGYDSVVGEDAQLSGGERQRVSIARAVLLDPPILVLDEATAAADASNEVAIQDALSRFAQGRTLLVIAHRLDTIMHADRILVLENGAIVEQGNHASLLAEQGRYARLWTLGGYDNSSKDTSC